MKEVTVTVKKMYLAILQDDFSFTGIGETIEDAFEALTGQVLGIEVDDCEFFDLVNPTRYTYALVQQKDSPKEAA
jgi:hypothetical protein